jgi:hypothetical protein
VSHPIPLHPDADLAVVLDDLRQSVAAWGDEGMVARLFRASICLMLLSILDTLIELLADFRAGRLPPVLEAEDETRDERIAPAPPVSRDSAGSFPQGAASRRLRAPGKDRVGACGPIPAGVAEQSAAQYPALARRGAVFPLARARVPCAARSPGRAVSPFTHQPSRDGPLKNSGVWMPRLAMSISLRYRNDLADLRSR